VKQAPLLRSPLGPDCARRLGQNVPAPVIFPLMLLAVTAVLVLGNAVAAIPARAAARTQRARGQRCG